MNKQMWEILVPTTRRVGGKPYTTRFHRVWDDKVRGIAGGLTILKPAKGHWVDPSVGTIYTERMIPVRIACDDEDMERIAQMTLKYYDQEAVLYYRVSELVKVVFRAPKDKHV